MLCVPQHTLARNSDIRPHAHTYTPLNILRLQTRELYELLQSHMMRVFPEELFHDLPRRLHEIFDKVR